MHILKFAIVVIVSMGLFGCGDPAGTACDIKGSAFTASHNCRHKCLEYWQVRCPDGNQVTPGVCTGRSDCDVGGCPDDQLCYHFEDPFDVRSYCVPNNVCGAPPEPAAQLQWERTAEARAAAMREKRQQQFNPNRERKTTAPAMGNQ